MNFLIRLEDKLRHLGRIFIKRKKKWSNIGAEQEGNLSYIHHEAYILE